MSRVFHPVFVLFMLVFSCSDKNDRSVSNFEEEEKEEKKVDRFIPNEWFYMQRSFPEGINKPFQIQEMKKVEALKAESEQRSAEHWEFVGPTNVGGRITDIEMPPSDMNTVYAGTASGGIFKSIDQGDTWEPIFDDAMSLAIGDMALSANDEILIYVGTGEANGGGGSIAYDGFGVYKTEDAGETWSHLGLETVGSIGKVIIDPTDDEKVFVAAMGDLFGNSPDRGIYRTENGGESWDLVLTLTDSTGGVDMVIHPENPDIILAAMWERLRRPSYRDYAGLSSGIYKTTDGGDNWTKLVGGLPTGEVGRIGLDISKSTPYQVYAVVGGDDLRYEGVYKSADMGENWQDLGLNGIERDETSYWFNKLFIDPQDSDKVFLAALDLYQSNDGGEFWYYSSDDMHVDQHSVFMHPLDPNLAFAGNDGGVYRSYDGGNSWEKRNTLPITQFYTCEIDPVDPSWIYGGTQDNGTQRSNSQVDGWSRVLGGDGFVVEVNPDDRENVYYEFQFGNLFRTDDFSITDRWIKPSSTENFNWNSPIALDPKEPSTIYFGGQSLWKSTNKGDDWTAIGTNFTSSIGSNLTFGTITSITVSPINSDVIYVGMDDGKVWGTRDAGDNWINLDQQIPDRWVTKVHASPKDENVVYVSISGYRYHEYIGHIFKSTNYGENWIDISQTLPQLPVNDIIIDPFFDGHIFAATDVAVFKTEDEGATWNIQGEGLPNVPVTDIDLEPKSGWLTAATYGRSMYRFKLDRGLGVNTQNLDPVASEMKVYPNPVQENSTLNFELYKSENLVVRIMDMQGKVVTELDSRMFDAGEHALPIESYDIPSGVYNIVLQSDIGNRSSFQIFKN